MSLLKSDNAFRIISVIFAVFLWIYVLDSSNPVISYDINVPLKVENENILKNKGLVIQNKNYPKSVTVSIKGRKDKVSSINSNDIDAVLNLSKLSDANKTSFIDVFINKNKQGVSVDGVTPRVLNIDVEKVGENPFPVKVTTNGKLKNNYKIVSVSAMPETVSIEGIDSVIDSIGEVRTVVDISNISKDTILKTECKVYSKDGKEMPEIEKIPSINVKIEVAKEVPIVPVVKGKPPKNYIDGVHTVAPSKALLAGPTSLLEQLDNVMTEAIDISDFTASTKKDAKLVLPEGSRLVDTPNSVLVDVKIEELSKKDLIIPKNNIIFENSLLEYKYSTLVDNISIRVLGLKEELEKLNFDTLIPSIDVKDLSEGTFNKALKINLPGSVKLDQEYELRISVEKNSVVPR